MRAQVDSPGLDLGDMRVDLRCGRAGMPHEVLHHTKVSAALQHMCREGVSQRVRMNTSRKPGLNAVSAHLLLDAALAQTSTKPVQKQSDAALTAGQLRPCLP